MSMHLLFGDVPYLYALRFRRRSLAGPGKWHEKLHSSRVFDGTARAMLFCGLKRTVEIASHEVNAAGVAVNVEVRATRFRNLATCPACLAALDRYLEQGRAAIKRTPKGPWVHLLFKPTPAQIAAVISRDEPGVAA